MQPGENGLVVTAVEPGSAAAAKGVQPGDVIVAVNQEPVDSVEAFEKAVSAAQKNNRKSVLLLLARDGGQRFVTVPIGHA